MKGFFVKHTYQGMGKIREVTPQGIRVQFFESEETTDFDCDAFSEHELVRTMLPLRSHCVSDGKECTIDSIVRSAQPLAPNFYDVTFTVDGLRARLSEVDLSPAGPGSSDDPLTVLAGLGQGGYSLFQVRESLVSALNRQLRHGGGLRALLSARIDLRPHQAYVAGLVLLDANRRYLLADEVGLGKTIEAGIIIHDLLINKPDAKILIVCPGALTQQWLCELYSKFGGHVFKLLELHSPEQIKWPQITKLIASFTQAAYEYADQILVHPWDMVVIDEAHHLLSSDVLCDFALRMSKAAPSLLLLSAIPAQRREDEFLRLLSLLEPDRYTPDVVADRDRFRHLFESQRAIGRKLRLLRRRVDGLKTGEFTTDETIEQAKDLISFPVLKDDAVLSRKVNGLACHPGSLEAELGDIMHYVGEMYRINRRILRNRRQRLVEAEQIVSIERQVSLKPYLAEQLEYEVNQSVNELLVFAKEQGLRDELLATLARVLWQSISHPHAVLHVLSVLASAEPRKLRERGIDFLVLGYFTGYEEWDLYLELLCKAVRHSISETLLQQAIACAARWKKDSAAFTRYVEMEKLLKQKTTSRGPFPKTLIFAGFPRIAVDLARRLRRDFGEESTTEFRSDLEREQKEENVRQFRSMPTTWLMVSDESGGEGRNFQFAHSLVHFDNPWSVARVEQRIGRLDRLGREKESSTTVVSEVIFDESSVEAGLVHCYDDGIGVYSRSVSGLEFALREVEEHIVQTAINDGREGLLESVSDLQALAEEERARDESEALLDEASFDRSAAEKYRRVRHSDENELVLEGAFTNYLQMIASTRSVRPYSDSEFPEGLWMLRGDEIHQIRDKSMNTLPDRMTPFIGTFRRAIAQQRVDLHFFNLGDPLFEAIYHTLFLDVAGRTYALEIKDFNREPWLGYEFIFNPSPKTSPIAANLGLQNRARQFFDFEPLHLFCTIDGHVEDDTEALLSLRRSLQRSDKNRIWWNLTKNKALVLQEVFASPSWDDLLYRQYEVAEKKATACLSAEVQAVVDDAHKQIDEEILRLCNGNGESSEVRQLKSLQESLLGWQVQLDSLGFLSINGRLSERMGND